MPNIVIQEEMEAAARILVANTERELKLVDDYYANERKKLKIKKYENRDA